VPRHRHLRVNAVAIAIAGALLLAACGGSTDSNTASQATESVDAPTTTPASDVGSDDATSVATEAGPVAVEDRPAMLRLAGADLNGVAFDNAAYAGQDVLLWFWAPW